MTESAFFSAHYASMAFNAKERGDAIAAKRGERSAVAARNAERVFRLASDLATAGDLANAEWNADKARAMLAAI